MKPSYLFKHFWLIAIFSLSAAISYAQDQNSDEALNALKEGNKRFCSGQLLHTHQDLSRIDELKTGQKPFAIVVSCSDSRVTPEIVFDQGLGDIFSIRTAGNVMADYEEGSIEYAAEHLGTKLIIVMGHTSCGAVKAFMDIKHSHENRDAHHTEKLGHIESIIQKLDSEEEENEVFKTEGDVYNRAIIANVIHGVKQLRKSEPFLKEMHEDGGIQIVGAIYHIESGEVEFLDI
ncbi:MAG: carbonic anhydrase [Prevotella sp.]|jgi:carbonic anhydrase|nr:carbonic anhydrase [Prevotella sp.]